MEAPPSREEGTYWHGTALALSRSNVQYGADDDSSWCDASDSPGHGSSLHTEWTCRQDRLQKERHAAQDGFNLGHRQSCVASLPDSLKEKLLLDAQRRGKLEDLCNSVQEILAESALRMFHKSMLQVNRQPEESKLQTIPKDLLLLLRGCQDVHVSEELKRVP
ncbi:hypothetical protein ZWY2020_026755 [Hordeum vulgare]|nr:hypothetical protein ZWY2020_026755 [Hordeum vulgare]